MAIYAKKLNGKQRVALKKYETLCGFEPMGQDDLDSGQIDFRELWRMNICWLEGVIADITNIDTDGCFNHSDEKI